ncbi:helix-turn-helix domain-containing protein [Chryseobacterium elymi]|uniref:Helix-turn-helix domain-containing protein n=1 Tax=Chryseobacterium elymi TaxID=395936 RepID=A0A3D9DNE6_9FLAO|nr:helix-turn-helix domain-containing protein [Chryseobacterium elymi]REC79351.1 helix-turn-helix domain-containing protein [Chryseobacterium elymi]
MKNLPPNYKLIYQDIISKKYPHKRAKCKGLLSKKELSSLDIIKVNSIIFDGADAEAFKFNQKLRSYNKATVLEILNYQKVNKLNNTQLAEKFNLSRNTISKWKKEFR